MRIARCGRTVSHLLSTRPVAPPSLLAAGFRRGFHVANPLLGIKSQVLKDVGEGITEVQIIQWYVEEGAHVEEWKPLCQYQSDKAVDDITSRYEGIIKKLHFQADDTVPTGRALCDIEVDDSKYPDDNPTPQATVPHSTEPTSTTSSSQAISAASISSEVPIPEPPETTPPPKSKHATLATPAVRGLLKELNVNILDVQGTGKDGRVLKEDVQKFAAMRDHGTAVKQQSSKTSSTSTAPRPTAGVDTPQTEDVVSLTPIQSQMFKTMTKSLSIPQFLFTDELNVSTLSTLRKKLANDRNNPQKVTYLPFIIKAVSLALEQYPVLNARIEISDELTAKPKLIYRTNHNIGIAMDTPQGLIVPNIKNVGARSILDIASEVTRLSKLGQEGKLTPADLSGGTITVSNIGNIGGTYLSPVIVPGEVAILGIGRSRKLPVFDEAGQVSAAEMVNFSWSADHRVVDGATMARMANVIREYIESPEKMLLKLR